MTDGPTTETIQALRKQCWDVVVLPESRRPERVKPFLDYVRYVGDSGIPNDMNHLAPHSQTSLAAEFLGIAGVGAELAKETEHADPARAYWQKTYNGLYLGTVREVTKIPEDQAGIRAEINNALGFMRKTVPLIQDDFVSGQVRVLLDRIPIDPNPAGLSNRFFREVAVQPANVAWDAERVLKLLPLVRSDVARREIAGELSSFPLLPDQMSRLEEASRYAGPNLLRRVGNAVHAARRELRR